MPIASIIVPAFNVASTVRETLDSLLNQTFKDFEIIVVDDGSTDDTHAIVQDYATAPRIKIVSQRNRGLAGARNTGIDAARGCAIGFCDADDIWEPEKLLLHIEHLKDNPDVGISFAGSYLIDENGDDLGLAQRPNLYDITSAHILKRNPIGNGSSAVIRREVFEQIAYRPRCERRRDWYFDEAFRQSEDIECWLRIALTTNWLFEGIPGLLTRYRINSDGLSSATDRQLDAWERMIFKLSALHPAFFARHTATARAYQMRYLARRAISDRDTDRATEMTRESLRNSLRPLVEEPVKTLSTIGATLALRYAGPTAIDLLMQTKEQKH